MPTQIARTAGENVKMAIDSGLYCFTADGGVRREFMCFVFDDMEISSKITEQERIDFKEKIQKELENSNSISLGGFLMEEHSHDGGRLDHLETSPEFERNMIKLKREFWNNFIRKYS